MEERSTPGPGPASPSNTLPRTLQGLVSAVWVYVALLLAIWVGIPLIPEETDLRFGLGYQALFTAMVLLSALVSWLLGKDLVPEPRSTWTVLGSVLGVIVLTVGLLVAAGMVYPQFDLPEVQGEAALDAAGRGEELFRNLRPSPCVQCHTVEGIRGGTRGPDLTGVALRAAERVAGLIAEEYLLEKVKAGMTYEFVVPEYNPMMPPFGVMLPEDQILDLVAYLLTLE